MGGGKKRKSVNKLSTVEENADTNKRIVHSNGNDSDYGVFSDPDEASDDKQPQSPTSPHSYIVELTPAEAIIEDASQSQSQSQSHSETTNVVIQEAEGNADKVSSEATEATEAIIVLDKSLDRLKMKLEKDAVYSKKTTLTSFFSYMILAMEIDIACSSTAATDNLASYDSTNAERLIEYIIRNHSSTSEVEQFTLTMLQLGIVTHIMNGVIEFNKTARVSTDSSNHSHTLQTLQSLEQLNLSQSGETGAGAGAGAATTQVTPTPTPTQKQPNCFIRFWRNMSCCCKCRKSRKESILESTSNDSDESNKSDEATMTTIMTTTKTSEEDSSLKQSNAGEEMKELTI